MSRRGRRVNYGRETEGPFEVGGRVGGEGPGEWGRVAAFKLVTGEVEQGLGVFFCFCFF